MADGAFGFMLHRAQTVLKQLRDVAKNGGAANGDAVLGHGGEEAGERVVNRGGGTDFSEDAEDFRADLDGFAILFLAAPVIEAEIGVARGEKHAAAAAPGRGGGAETVGLPGGDRERRASASVWWQIPSAGAEGTGGAGD